MVWLEWFSCVRFHVSFTFQVDQSWLFQKIVSAVMVPYTNRIWPGLTEFAPPLWQVEADSVTFMSASPATAEGQILLVYGTPSIHKTSIPCSIGKERVAYDGALQTSVWLQQNVEKL